MIGVKLIPFEISNFSVLLVGGDSWDDAKFYVFYPILNKKCLDF